MHPSPPANWIGGRWQPGAAGHVFEVGSLRAPYALRGAWPRSDAADLRQALEAGREAELPWGRWEREERLAVLLGALEELEGAQLAARLADGLGWPAERLEGLVQEDLFRCREALELLREGGQAPARGCGLFQAHWSDLVGGLLGRLAARLLAGSPAVVLADGRLPEAAHALAAALAAGGLPAGTVAVLHDDGATVLRAAQELSSLAWMRLRGERSRLEELVARRQPEGFAAGLTECSAWPLASAVHVVGREADPLAAAHHVAQHALAPSATLCGQLPDRIGRVLCHQRQLSRFTEALLVRLDACGDLARAIPLVERELFGWLRAAWSLGLDEGAAPIFGEAPSDNASRAPAGDDPPRPAADRPARRRAPRAARPLLFTNVEAGGRLLELDRPAPLLRLVRVASDEEARALEQDLVRRSRRPLQPAADPLPASPP